VDAEMATATARVAALAAECNVTDAAMFLQVVLTGIEVEEVRQRGPQVAVEIQRGSRSSLRSVVFRGPERSYALVVEPRSVNDRESTMYVGVLETRADEVHVKFHRPPAQGPANVWLPRAMVLGLPSVPSEEDRRSAGGSGHIVETASHELEAGGRAVRVRGAR
jgi:hypothetical protein